MRIGLVLYPIQDLGGIISHTEQLAYGLRELGHQVNLHILYWQDSFRYPAPDKDLYRRGWVRGAFCAVNQQSGWNGIPWEHKLSYKGDANKKRTMDILSGYDLVIWEVPVPSKSKQNEGNSDWLELYSACQKNIAILHDGNLFNIPWIVGVRKFFTALVCVHECAFNLGKNLDIPRALILNPQDLSGVQEEFNYMERAPGFLSIQVFKSWKRVDDVLRAIPYVHDSVRKIVAGGGIEQRYMTSEFKTKPSYYCQQEDDPDLPLGFERNPTRIWDLARIKGMEYLGFISPFKRDVILSGIRTLIDSSWSHKYNDHGSHFNRVIVDAMKMGVVPIATNLGMSKDESGAGDLFNPNANYICIPYDVYPKWYASYINHANNLSRDEAEVIISNNFNLLDHFDRKKVAQDFIDLSEGKNCGFYGKRRMGTLNEDLKRASNEGIKFFRTKKPIFK